MQYMGSKNRLAKELVPIIQSYITTETKGYLEPFVGGANVIDKINCNKKYGSDLNEYLIELLKYSAENELPKTITEEEYCRVKSNREEYDKWYVGLVGFCGSYGAKFFDTYARGNDNRDRQSEAIRNIKKQASNLKGIVFKHCSFQDINNIKGFVIYCDPPYRGTASYSTGDFPYDEFYEWCRNMSKNNIVLVSEYNMPSDFKCIWEKEHKCLMYSRKESNDDKNKRIEKLFIIK